MVVEYKQEEVFTKSIDVVDVGNSAIRCTANNFSEYYILTKTSFGKTYIMRYGPIIPDQACFNDFFSLIYKKIDFKENKIKNEISSLLNDSKIEIVEAEEIPIEEAMLDFPNIAELYLNAGSDE